MSYPGSKGQAGVWQRIIGQMPPHSVYVEAFAGSAQIFFRKAPAPLSILIDANASVNASLSVAVRNAGFDVPADVEIIPGDALQWLAKWQPHRRTLLYCDPPYMLHTRTKKRLYGQFEMTDDDHATLLSTLRALPCYVMLSGYPSDLYSSRLQDWRCLRYQTRTRGRTLTECLWMNFPEPTVLHDWRFAGRNHRERVTLKRLATRFLTRLDGMPARKRGYLLNELFVHQRQSRPVPIEDIVTPILTSPAVPPGRDAKTGVAGSTHAKFGVTAGI